MDENTRKKIGIVVLILGIIITFTIMTFYPAGNKGAGELALTGAIVSTIRSIYDCKKTWKK